MRVEDNQVSSLFFSPLLHYKEHANCNFVAKILSSNSFVNFLHSCVTFLLAFSSFFFFHSIYSFLWFKISQNSSIPFQSPPLLEVSLFFPREILLKISFKIPYKIFLKSSSNSNSDCYTQDHDFKVCYSLLSINTQQPNCTINYDPLITTNKLQLLFIIYF